MSNVVPMLVRVLLLVLREVLNAVVVLNAVFFAVRYVVLNPVT